MTSDKKNAPEQRANAAGGSENHVGAGLGSDCTANRRQTDPVLGAELRDQGVALTDAAGDPWWRACADTALRYLSNRARRHRGVQRLYRSGAGR